MRTTQQRACMCVLTYTGEMYGKEPFMLFMVPGRSPRGLDVLCGKIVVVPIKPAPCARGTYDIFTRLLMTPSQD